MSDLEQKLQEKKERLQAKVAGKVATVKRSLATRMGRAAAWTVIGFVVLVAVLLAQSLVLVVALCSFGDFPLVNRSPQ